MYLYARFPEVQTLHEIKIKPLCTPNDNGNQITEVELVEIRVSICK